MNRDLKTMSRQQLEELLVDVKIALEAAQERDRCNAREAAERAAAEFGFSLNDLNDDAFTEKKKIKGPKKPSKPKYANPDDASQTWTGKGRQPNWFRAAVVQGLNPADMEI